MSCISRCLQNVSARVVHAPMLGRASNGLQRFFSAKSVGQDLSDFGHPDQAKRIHEKLYMALAYPPSDSIALVPMSEKTVICLRELMDRRGFSMTNLGNEYDMAYNQAKVINEAICFLNKHEKPSS